MVKFLFSINLTPRQIEIVEAVAWGKRQRTIILCPTRYGKSFCVSLGVLIWILVNKDKKIAIVAPTNEKTTIIRNHIANFVSLSPYFSSLLDIDKTGISKIKKKGTLGVS